MSKVVKDYMDRDLELPSEEEFMATFTNPLYSILDDKNEFQNFDDEVTWLN